MMIKNILCAIVRSPAAANKASASAGGTTYSTVLLNAVKYTEHGGRIWFAAVGERNDVVVSVGDTGIGASDEFIARAFDMFTQAEHDQSYARGGLGIGLSLVRSVAELHGGTVAARSDGLPKGSEFIVRLPKIAKDSR